MTEHRVVILGDAWIEEIRDPGGVRESVGGDAVELAYALIGDGLSLTVVVPLGDDPDGERIRTVLEDRGVRVVGVPALDGTHRRSLVRDRSGAEFERRRGEGGFADTRRSLAAQADADVIVDLREGIPSTVAEERDDVLRALGLSPVATPSDAEAPGIGGEASARADAAAGTAPTDGSPSAATLSGEGDAAERVAVEPAAVPPAHPAVLLPAPVAAGAFRHAPVRLLPEPLVAPAPAPDWHGLEERIARVAT
jgi:sugar/nucleoside kinase (ribokinase family)